YGAVLVWSVLLLVPHSFFAGGDSVLAPVSAWFRSASPIAAMMSLLGAGDIGGRGFMSTADVPVRFVLITVALSLLLLGWTWLRLNSRRFDRDRSTGMVVDEQARSVRIARRLVFIVDPRRRSRSIGRFVNPVMVKEFRCRRFGRLHWL